MEIQDTIVFCETSAHVEFLLNNKEFFESIGLFLALEPEAAWVLHCKGIEYSKPEDFYDEYALGEMRYLIFDEQNKWVEWIDGYLQEHITEFHNFKFQPAAYSFFFLKRCMDAVLYRAHILEHLYDAVRPERAFYFDNPKSHEITWKLLSEAFILPSYYPIILPIWARKHDVELTKLQSPDAVVPSISNGPAPVKAPRNLKRWVRNHLPAGLRSILRSLKQRVSIEGTLNNQDKFPDDWPELLILRGGYDVDKLVTECPKHQIKPTSWNEWTSEFNYKKGSCDSVITHRLENLWNDIRTRDELWQPFSLMGLNLREIAEPWIKDWWMNDIEIMWAAFVQMRQRFTERRPLAVVASLTWDIHEAPVMHAAKLVGIPTFIYQHGGYLGVGEYIGWDGTDIFNSDWLLVYGDGVANHVLERRQHYTDNRARPLTVGSARLDAIRRQSHSEAFQFRKMLQTDKPLVVYVPTMLRGHLRLLCASDYPEISYFELQRNVLELFGLFPDIQFIWKTFDDRHKNPIPDIIHDSYPNVFEVGYFNQGVPRLPELIWAVDAIIVDFPSTALLESLLTRKPLVVYADKRFLRIFAEAKEMLRRRCPLAETPEDFLAEIRRLLSSRPKAFGVGEPCEQFAEIEDPDNSFLEAYGTYLNDGRSAERAVEALLQICTSTSV